ncbi:hypothetical protein ACHAW6_000819 [Cyclotella cf. meneghiniana]
MSINLANFYLMTPLKQPKFAKMKLSNIPEKIRHEYKLHKNTTPNGWVYIRCTRGMYGLSQAGSLGHDLLEKCLNKDGYYQSPIVPGLWKHTTRPIQFTSVLDNFGVKYTSRNKANYLIDTLKKHYDVSADYTGRKYVKINLDWDYNKGKVHLSMAPFHDKALKHFENSTPSIVQDSPHPHTPQNYGALVEMTHTDTSTKVDKAPQKHLQQVLGTLLWYRCGVNSSILTVLSTLSSQQTQPTINTMT